MNIKIYEYTGEDGVKLLAPHTWSTEIKKARIKNFIYGIGPVNWPKKKVIEHEEECPDKFSYAECRRLYDKYNFYIAEHYVQECRITCDISARSYVYIARAPKDASVLDMIQDTFKFNIREHTDSLIVFGTFLFPLVEFDDHMHKEFDYKEEEHGSLKDFITKKWGPEICEKVEGVLTS